MRRGCSTFVFSTSHSGSGRVVSRISRSGNCAIAHGRDYVSCDGSQIINGDVDTEIVADRENDNLTYFYGGVASSSLDCESAVTMYSVKTWVSTKKSEGSHEDVHRLDPCVIDPFMFLQDMVEARKYPHRSQLKDWHCCAAAMSTRFLW